MKTLAVFAVVLGSLLSGCIAVPVDDGRGYSQNPHRDRDRDGDGVRNSQDRRPDDPRRY
jgi:hypothetical protein